MAENGKKIAMAIGIYLLVKQFVNVMLGASIFSMLIPFVISVFFYLNLSEYTNYIAGAVIVFIAVWHLPDNLRNFPSSWLYLTEGILDLVASVVLIFSQDIKAYFSKS